MAETSNSPQPTSALTPMQEEMDALLRQVSRQIEEGTLDTNDQALFERLVNGFADTRGLVRLRIAETLGSEIGRPTTQAVIAGLAHNENPVVRRACGKTLTLIGNPEAIPTLIERLLHDEDTVVHGSCAGALASLGTPAVPALLEVLHQPDLPETTKGHVIWALAFNALEAKETFYESYQSEAVAVRAAAVGAIAKIAQDAPEPKAFELLIAALDDAAEDVRSEAAAVLGNITHQPALPKLFEMLGHAEPSARKAAALAIMKIGDGEAIAPIQAAATQETNDEVAAAMKLAILQLGRKVSEAEDDGWD